MYNPYGYNPYGYNPYSYNSWSYSPFNQGYYGYGGYYSPLYPVVFYKNPKVYTGTTGKSNLTTFQNRNYSNVNTPGNYSNSKGRNSEANFGNLMKRVFATPSGTSNTNNQQSTSWDRPVRTMEPTSTPSSSAGGRSGGYNSTGTSTSTGRPPRWFLACSLLYPEESGQLPALFLYNLVPSPSTYEKIFTFSERVLFGLYGWRPNSGRRFKK